MMPDLANVNDLFDLELAAARGQLSPQDQVLLIEALRDQAEELERLADIEGRVLDAEAEADDLRDELREREAEVERLNHELSDLAEELAHAEAAR